MTDTKKEVAGMRVTKTEREATQKGRRTVRALNTEVGRGDPTDLGIIQMDAVRKVGDAQRPSKSTREYIKLLEAAVEEQGEWFNRKVYYDEAPEAHPFGTVISTMTGSAPKSAVNHNIYRQLDETVKRLTKVYGGAFEVQHTRECVRSDNPIKGSIMHVLFVRFVRSPKPKLSDVMALSNGADADYLANRSEHGYREG